MWPEHSELHPKGGPIANQKQTKTIKLRADRAPIQRKSIKIKTPPHSKYGIDAKEKRIIHSSVHFYKVQKQKTEGNPKNQRNPNVVEANNAPTPRKSKKSKTNQNLQQLYGQQGTHAHPTSVA